MLGEIKFIVIASRLTIHNFAELILSEFDGLAVNSWTWIPGFFYLPTYKSFGGFNRTVDLD